MSLSLHNLLTIKSRVSLLPILHRLSHVNFDIATTFKTYQTQTQGNKLFKSMEDLLTRTDSVGKKRVKQESDLDSPSVKRLKDDLFDESSHDSTIQDLDSLMKSFEDELSSTTTETVHVNETQPDLGYLFEASDDELGLPPAPPQPPTELVRVSSDSSDVVDELCGLDDDRVTGFDSFDLSDGIFEYSDVCLDSGDLFSWRPESLPAE